MSYIEIFPALITGKNNVFELARDGKARNIALLNITITGILFGLSNLAGTLKITPELPIQGNYALITPLLFSVYGIVTVCAATIGFCLIYWAAAKAFGGPGGFGLILDLIGLAAIPFWVLAPLLNYTLKFSQSGAIPLFLLILIVLAFAWSFKLIRQSMVVGQGLSVGKATMAVACMWIFSISSVYVFLP
jgi:hypothetical protein